MKESKFLGTLLPSHPDFLSIVQAIREEYKLPEVSPDGEPITEIYLGDEIIPLEEFRKDIENRVRENLSFLPPDLLKIYLPAKMLSATPYEVQYREEIESLPDNVQTQMEAFFKLAEKFMNLFIQIVDPMISAIVNMLYTYLLIGEANEVPNDWISKVVSIKAMGEPMILAMAGQMANPDVIVQQFREEYKKTFGEYHPKITQTVTSTAYYLQLKMAGKPWNYIVEEYIRSNKFNLPRDRSSKRYSDTWHLYEQRLKKRLQRTRKVLDVLIRDKKL